MYMYMYIYIYEIRNIIYIYIYLVSILFYYSTLYHIISYHIIYEIRYKYNAEIEPRSSSLLSSLAAFAILRGAVRPGAAEAELRLPGLILACKAKL